MTTRIAIPEKIKCDVLSRSNNRCCVCQTPFVQLHHLDGDSSNNDIDNLAPLCPNCHSQAHAANKHVLNLNPARLKELRDKWYSYCENRKDGSTISGNAHLKLKILIQDLGDADYSWKKMFSALDPNYKDMTRDEIVNHVFSTSNRDDLQAGLAGDEKYVSK